MQGSVLDGANFLNARLDCSKLTNATLHSVIFTEASIDEVEIDKKHYEKLINKSHYDFIQKGHNGKGYLTSIRCDKNGNVAKVSLE